MPDIPAGVPTLADLGFTANSLLDALKNRLSLQDTDVVAATLYAHEIEPAVVAAVEQARPEALDPSLGRLIFRGLHVLAARRLTAVYRPLIAILHGPEHPERVLGDAVTETLSRILIGVFDGDSAPLLSLIRDTTAGEWVRDAAYGALAFLTFDGRIPRAATEDFLRRFERESRTPPEDAAWYGWMIAVALLGLNELSPRVHAAFEDGRIPSYVAREEDYRELLDRALAGPDDPARFGDENLGYIEDVLESFGPRFNESDPDDDEFGRAELPWRPQDHVPGHNPLRHVGRNDPCRCGSGNKFKKCCMQHT